jgi:hypothetical protein
VTRRSIEEYAEAVRRRYARAARKAKTEMLNEFVATTGMHRKAVIRSLNQRSNSRGDKKRRRPASYGLEVMAALKVVWEASDCLCSKRLQRFLREPVGIPKRCGGLTMAEETEAQLGQMSASTIDRALRGCPRSNTRRGLSATKPGTLLKNSIPIRTFSEANESKPGFVEADLVAHCGGSAEGFLS